MGKQHAFGSKLSLSLADDAGGTEHAGSNHACCHDHHAGCDHACSQQHPDDVFVQPGDV